MTGPGWLNFVLADDYDDNDDEDDDDDADHDADDDDDDDGDSDGDDDENFYWKEKVEAHNNHSGQMPSNWCMHSLLRIRIMMIMIMIMMVMIMIMIMMIMLKLMVISSMRWGVLQRFSAIHFFWL